ncbi:hypothetical protein NIES2111_44270 [Nostoc sp. NIES-2111]|nr:hypothetical protein NIES2111_44270 [Nostoc sp. NIES-2111]
MQKLVAEKLSYIHQVKIVLITVLATLIPLSSVLIIVDSTTDLPLEDLTRDPSAIMEIPPYIGIFSNIGILFWCACTTICLFTCLLLKKANRFPEYTKFLFYSGLLTGLLLLDDFFLLHETVLPEYMFISERKVYAVYLMIGLTFLVKFRKILQKTEYVIFANAIIFFALSIISDTIWEEISNAVEDTFKLIGIVNWVTYFFRLSLLKMNSIFNVSSVKLEAALTTTDITLR